MGRLNRLLMLIALAMLAVGALSAQEEKYALRQISFKVYDEFHRELVAPPKTAFLGVRLAEQQDPPLTPGAQIGNTERSYTAGETGYQKFEITEAVSRPTFVVYRQDERPILYEVVALIREPGSTVDRVVKLDKSIWPVSNNSATTGLSLRTPTYVAPMQGWEWLLFGGFAGASLLFIFWGLFRELFRRLLFNRRWRVSKAENWTNAISFFMVLLLAATLLVLRFAPNWVQGMYLYSCLAAIGAYSLVLLLTFSVSMLATGKK
jgi:hypothetical protein